MKIFIKLGLILTELAMGKIFKILFYLLLWGMITCGDAPVSITSPQEIPVNVENVNVNQGICFKNWEDLENFCQELYGDSLQ